MEVYMYEIDVLKLGLFENAKSDNMCSAGVFVSISERGVGLAATFQDIYSILNSVAGIQLGLVPDGYSHFNSA